MPAKQQMRRQPLPVAEVVALATELANKIAHRPDDVDDLIQVGMAKLYYCLKRYCRRRKSPIRVRNYYAYSVLCMKREMWRWYSVGGRNRRILDQAISLHVKPRYDRLGRALLDFVGAGSEVVMYPRVEAEQTELLELGEYFATLEATHGPLARRVAENLYAPQDLSLCRHLLEQGGKRVAVSHKTVREGLGLSPEQWQGVLTLVQDFTREWFARGRD